MNQTLIMDAGSSKVDWAYLSKDKVKLFSSLGYNPYTHPIERLEQISEKARDHFSDTFHRIYYYGSGVSGSHVGTIQAHLEKWLSCQHVYVEDDLLGAARAACQRSPGVVAIAGTGSNLCQYDGVKIIHRAVNLGYILGDEGSGNHLGRILLKRYFYKQLPKHLSQSLEKQYPKLNRNSFLQALFSSQHPNTLLAQYARFVHIHRKDIYMQSLILHSFKEFIRKHIIPLGENSDDTIHFIGSIGYQFKSEWIKALSEFKIPVGSFWEKPIDGLIEYHKNF